MKITHEWSYNGSLWFQGEDRVNLPLHFRAKARYEGYEGKEKVDILIISHKERMQDQGSSWDVYTAQAFDEETLMPLNIDLLYDIGYKGSPIVATYQVEG